MKMSPALKTICANDLLNSTLVKNAEPLQREHLGLLILAELLDNTELLPASVDDTEYWSVMPFLDNLNLNQAEGSGIYEFTQNLLFTFENIQRV